MNDEYVQAAVTAEPDADLQREFDLELLLADKKYKLGRLLTLCGIIGTIIAAIILFVLDVNDYVFMWGETKFFHSYIFACPFAVVAATGAVICRKHCMLHGMPKRNSSFYSAVYIVSSILVALVLFWNFAMLAVNGHASRHDIELVPGEKIAVLDTVNHPNYKNIDVTIIEIYACHGFLAKRSDMVVGTFDSITYDEATGEYVIAYHRTLTDEEAERNGSDKIQNYTSRFRFE